MKHTYLLLITTFVLFIPSINLDASQAKKNDAKKLQSKSVTLAKKKRPIGKKKPSSPQAKDLSKNITAENLATLILGTATSEDTPPPPFQNTDKKSEQPNSSDQDDELSAESDSGTPVSPQNLTEQDLFEDPEIIDKKLTMDEIHREGVCESEKDGKFSDGALVACLGQIFKGPITPDKSATAKQKIKQDLFEELEIIEKQPTMGEIRQEEAIDFCKREGDGLILSGRVSSALAWASKQIITPEERTAAGKEMTDGLCELYSKNKENFEELKKLTTQATSETLKTNTLISALKISEKIRKRLEASCIIVNNKTGIQISENNLNDFNQLSQEYVFHIKTVFGIHFDFGKSNLFRKNKMRLRIQKKSLKPEDIGYEPLNLNSIIAQVTGISEDELAQTESDDIVDDGNDSEIDEETQAATDYYSYSWSFFNSIKRGLTYANQSAIDEKVFTTAKKEMTDSLQELIQRSNDNYDNAAAIDSISTIQSLTKKMELSETVQRRLEAGRFIMKNRGDVQLYERDLLDFNNICAISQEKDINALQQSFSFTQDRVKRADEMCTSVRAKSLRAEDIDYDPIDTSRHAIFQSAMQSFQAKELAVVSVIIEAIEANES